jgi:hypothetical protein
MNVDMNALTERFSQLAEQHGPAVVETARMAAQVQAMSAISGGVTGLAIAALLAYGARRVWRFFEAQEEIPVGFLCASILYAFAFLSMIVSAFCLFDPWIWATLFVNPDLWIAKRILGL